MINMAYHVKEADQVWFVGEKVIFRVDASKGEAARSLLHSSNSWKNDILI